MSIDHEDDYEGTTDDSADTGEVDEAEAVAAEKGGSDDADGGGGGGSLSDADLAEAESLTVTAKQSIRDQLEAELERFLAQGGRITEVPPDDSVHE
jgi:hypothetical protein